MKIPLQSRWHIFFLIFFSAIVLFADFLTERNVRISTLFVLPVALSAWTNHKYLAYILSFILPCVRLLFIIYWQQLNNIDTGCINALIRIGVLLIITILADQARQALELRRQVNLLEGILPICSSCKKIRDNKGNWHQIESYISDKTDTEFSHSICPDCMKKLYPEFNNKK